MRLLDNIRQPHHWDRIGPRMRGFLSEAQVIVADQVTEYMFALNPKEYWNTEDFPNMAPPFEVFWIETVAPSMILSEEHGQLRWDQGLGADSKGNPSIEVFPSRRPVRWGMLFIASEGGRPLREHKGARTFYTDDELQRVRWTLNGTLFTELADGTVGPMWAWAVPILADGTIWKKYDPVLKEDITGLSYTLIPETQRWPAQGEDGRLRYKSLRYEAHAYANPLFLTICFMHAKNATLTVRHPDRALNARRAKRGHRPLLSYKVLEVEPIKRILDASRRPGERTDMQLALHRCRGHFKHYTAEKPLLGRHVGTWFWAEQLRGHGGPAAVNKEYVPRPEPAAPAGKEE